MAVIGRKSYLTKAAEICVEILFPSYSRREMQEKKALYFAAGAEGAWFCTASDEMTFYIDPQSVGEATSRICQKFPGKVEV